MSGRDSAGGTGDFGTSLHELRSPRGMSHELRSPRGMSHELRSPRGMRMGAGARWFCHRARVRAGRAVAALRADFV
jgi:hypothetical protein